MLCHNKIHNRFQQVSAENLRFCLNSSHSWMSGENAGSIIEKTGPRLGIIVLSTPTRDDFGQLYDAHQPLAGSGYDLDWLTYCPEVPRVLVGNYTDSDEEYADWLLLDKILTSSKDGVRTK